MTYRVMATQTYLNEIQSWPKADQEAAVKIQKHLASNPFAGDPLSYRFLREKRVGGRRIYYLIYTDLELILLVATSQKKDQQTTINYIKNQLEEFKRTAQEFAKRLS